MNNNIKISPEPETTKPKIKPAPIRVEERIIADGCEPDNAHIIAAAPEMYEVLKECVYHIGNACAHYPMPETARQTWIKADKALAKAEGKGGEG